jgi:hypothetical protein
MRRLEALQRQGFDKSFPMRRDNQGRFNASILVACSQCEVLVINGVPTHEHGCPNLRKAKQQDDEDES